MKKLEPITPGEILLEEFLKPMGLRVHSKINLHFQVLRRLTGKTGKWLNIEIFKHFHNVAEQDGSTPENVKLFLSEP